MKLRIFAVCLSVILAAAWNERAEGQQRYRMGFLSVATSAGMADRLERFRQGLSELGYVEGMWKAAMLRSNIAGARGEKNDFCLWLSV